MQSRLLLPPAYEPVTLAEVKAYLRVTHTLEDDLIWTITRSARKKCEDVARIAISPQTWITTYRTPQRRGDIFGLTDDVSDPERILDRLVLPRPPLVTVKSVFLQHRSGGTNGILFTAGTETPAVLLTDLYGVYNVDPVTGVMNWVDKQTLYTLSDPWYPTLQITYDCGFAAAEDLQPGAEPDRTVRQVECPDDIREAIYVTAAATYDNRGRDGTQIPQKAIELLTPYYNSPRLAG